MTSQATTRIKLTDAEKSNSKPIAIIDIIDKDGFSSDYDAIFVYEDQSAKISQGVSFSERTIKYLENWELMDTWLLKNCFCEIDDH